VNENNYYEDMATPRGARRTPSRGWLALRAGGLHRSVRQLPGPAPHSSSTPAARWCVLMTSRSACGGDPAGDRAAAGRQLSCKPDGGRTSWPALANLVLRSAEQLQIVCCLLPRSSEIAEENISS